MPDLWYNEASVVFAMLAITAFFLTPMFGWRTQRELAVTARMVVAMVGVAAVFFLLADRIMRRVLILVLSTGS